MTQSDQLVVDRGAQAGLARSGERGARRTLRAQVARLERELSAIVADRFPYISAVPGAGSPLDRWFAIEMMVQSRDSPYQRSARISSVSPATTV